MTHAPRVFCFLEKYIAYDTAAAWQRCIADEVRRGAPEALALFQHAPVYTLGRRARYDHLLAPRLDLERSGAEVMHSDRGGDVTYHGPGQLVAYPILHLRKRGLGPKTYVHALESVLIQTLERFDIAAGRVSGRPGVWVGNDKIAAIGVRIEGGVTTHGFALNVTTDLDRFGAIVPCGLRDAGVTSMKGILGHAPDLHEVAGTLLEVFQGAFDCPASTSTRELQDIEAQESVLSHGG